MRILKPAFFFFLMTVALVASAEVQVIDGKKVECKDGVCVLVEEKVQEVQKVQGVQEAVSAPRIAQGYMSAEEFIAFLENREVKPLGDAGLWMTLLLVLLGGLAMNLTPCVLPMIPINLMIIGRSAWRGTAYGLGMAVAYGALGVAAAFGGLAFGAIQGNPWFNAVVAVIFVGLALALFDVFFIDLSRFRPNQTTQTIPTTQTIIFPFFMGALSAVLSGACVAPILISVLLLTGKLYAEGKVLALGLPFVLGVGMALPWPFLGAGLKVLPQPGAWMKGVNRVLGMIVVGFAVWYGWLAWQGFRSVSADKREGSLHEATTGTLSSTIRFFASKGQTPILVDCWATWCKNCSGMDRVLESEKVKKVLKSYTVIRVRVNDLMDLRRVKGFESIRGLPAFVIFDKL